MFWLDPRVVLALAALLCGFLLFVVLPVLLLLGVLDDIIRQLRRNPRSLIRFDLAAIMTVVFGVSAALAFMQELSPGEKLVAGVVLVPIFLLLAWVGRICCEDLWWSTRRRRPTSSQPPEWGQVQGAEEAPAGESPPPAPHSTSQLRTTTESPESPGPPDGHNGAPARMISGNDASE